MCSSHPKTIVPTEFINSSIRNTASVIEHCYRDVVSKFDNVAGSESIYIVEYKSRFSQQRCLPPIRSLSS